MRGPKVRNPVRSANESVSARFPLYMPSALPRWSSWSYSSLVKKVAVFGNAGGGKSRLARRLAELTGLPLYVVDMIQFRPGGAKVPHNEFLQAHADLLRCDEWIIDGFGDMATAWERFAVAIRWFTSICLSSLISGG